MRVGGKSDICYFGYLFYDYCIMYSIIGIFFLCKRIMIFYQYFWSMYRVQVFEMFYNYIVCFLFVGIFYFFFSYICGIRNGVMEIIGMSCFDIGDIYFGLCLGGSIGGVGMYYFIYFGECFIQNYMGGSI